MKKLIILLHPKTGDMEQFKDAPNPPLNLLLVSVYLYKKYNIKIIDQRVEKNWQQKLINLLKKTPICVGITCYTGPMIAQAITMCKVIRQYSSAPLIWGGIHPSILPEQTLKNKYVDIVVEGEGENVFPQVVQALENKNSLQGIAGVWFKDNGKIYHTPPNDFIDPNNIPQIPYHLINVEKYVTAYRHERSFSYLSSRGCPFRCTYCYNIVYNKSKWRAIKEEKVIEEIKYLKQKYNINNIYFLDDNFFIDKKRAFNIVKTLHNLGISWELQGIDLYSIKSMNEEEIALLEKYGCKRITIGVESADNKIRQLLKKRGDIQQVKKQLTRLLNKKFIVLCSFIVGFPEESLKEINTTIKFALKILKMGNNIRIPMIYNFIPYPGTELFAATVKNGFKPPASLEEWGEYAYEKQKVIQDKQLIKYLENISFLSIFLDNKINDYGTYWYFKLLYELYRPLAWLRMKTKFLKFVPERYLYNFTKKLLYF